MDKYGRRTWDREEYAKLAAEGTRTFQESIRNLGHDQLRALKEKYSDYDGLIRLSMQGLNKKVLVTGVSSFKKGKQYGFYCELCNLTFKDTLQYIDHLNHKTHQIIFESIFDEPLVLDIRDNDNVGADELKQEYKNLMQNFVKKHSKAADTKKRKFDGSIGGKDVRESLKISSQVNDVMGFNNFGSSKK